MWPTTSSAHLIGPGLTERLDTFGLDNNFTNYASATIKL